jgi:biotin operon repressor BirA-like protein
MKPLVSTARVRARPALSSRRRAADVPSDVLAALASGDEWSGSALASSLGVTRAAVWKQIERLRSLGVTIQAVAGRGYRLDAPIDLLDAARIGASIAPQQRDPKQHGDTSGREQPSIPKKIDIAAHIPRASNIALRAIVVGYYLTGHAFHKLTPAQQCVGRADHKTNDRCRRRAGQPPTTRQ